jgi:hypothetical protein
MVGWRPQLVPNWINPQRQPFGLRQRIDKGCYEASRVVVWHHFVQRRRQQPSVLTAKWADRHADIPPAKLAEPYLIGTPPQHPMGALRDCCEATFETGSKPLPYGFHATQFFVLRWCRAGHEELRSE